MLAYPTDPALPPFEIGADVDTPTMILVGTTVHLVLAQKAECVEDVMDVTQPSRPSRSFMLLEIDELSERWTAVHWRSVHVDVIGHQHVLAMTVAADSVRFPAEDDPGHSENSFAAWGEHELAASELTRFGLSAGTLAFEGTRTLRVWHAQPRERGAPLPVTCIYEQHGLHFYSLMRSVRDAAEQLFPKLDGDDSIQAG